MPLSSRGTAGSTRSIGVESPGGGGCSSEASRGSSREAPQLARWTNRFTEIRNEHSFGFMAVSLGYFETLMSCSSSSASSELSEAEQAAGRGGRDGRESGMIVRLTGATH